MPITARTIVWRNFDEPGSEFCTLSPAADGWRFDGTVIIALDGRPFLARYAVDCDAEWHTREVKVELRGSAETRSLRLAVDAEERWWRGDEELAALRGCRDVDLSVTPATNTLPIRRLSLVVGDAREITAAWVRFPELTVEPLAQRYTRLAANRYRYENVHSEFVAELSVDDLGLVTRYGDYFARVATGT